jgi:dTDP-glucose pyrophosphorylase
MSNHRLTDCLIDERATIKEVMVALDRGALEIALVIDKQGRLLGTCTDGDVRRALLAGFGFDSPISIHMQREFVAVAPHVARAEVLDLMRARHIQQVPVVNPDGVLSGLHLMRELIGSVERPNWAVLMAGGKGSRLRPLTETLPKPMIPVAGRPILERLVLHLVGYGIGRIFISTNYLGEMVEAFFGDGSQYGCTIEYLREDLPLGTGGSLALLPEPPEHPLIVMNGDLVTEVDLAEMLAFHSTGKYVASVGIREYWHTVPFGVVQAVDDRLRIIAEKPTYSWFVNTGCYLLSPSMVARLPKGTECSIVSLLEDALTRAEPVGAYRITADWLDVGRISDLAQAVGTGSSPDLPESVHDRFPAFKCEARPLRIASSVPSLLARGT